MLVNVDKEADAASIKLIFEIDRNNQVYIYTLIYVCQGQHVIYDVTRHTKRPLKYTGIFMYWLVIRAGMKDSCYTDHACIKFKLIKKFMRCAML